jgi:hypothetical protein
LVANPRLHIEQQTFIERDSIDEILTVNSLSSLFVILGNPKLTMNRTVTKPTRKPSQEAMVFAIIGGPRPPKKLPTAAKSKSINKTVSTMASFYVLIFKPVAPAIERLVHIPL